MLLIESIRKQRLTGRNSCMLMSAGLSRSDGMICCNGGRWCSRTTLDGAWDTLEYDTFTGSDGTDMTGVATGVPLFDADDMGADGNGAALGAEISGW